MSVLLDVTFQDVNQREATSSLWVDQESDVISVLASLKACSNARIVRAVLSTPVPIVTLIDNNATNANVETATQKAIIVMRGADASSSGEPFAHARVAIPAPIGSLINGLSGDVTNADANTLKNQVLSKTGVQMDVIEKIVYSKTR